MVVSTLNMWTAGHSTDRRFSTKEPSRMKRHCILLSALLPVLAGCGSDAIDVAGQVIYSDGPPLPGAKVKVGTKGIVTTGPDGTFSVRSVEAPYDLTAVSADGAIARVFVG